MFRVPRPLLTLLFSVLLVGTGNVWAQPKTHQSQPQTQPTAEPQSPQSQSKGSHGTLPDSVRRVERETGGEVLRAEPMQRDGREVYRMKVLTADGRVRVVQDDPSDYETAARPASGQDKKKASSNDPDDDPPQY